MDIGEEETTVQSQVRPANTLTRIAARVIYGHARGMSGELLPDSSLSIGKSPDNQLLLADETVSRYHAELSLRRELIEVRDLDSMNGTYVNDVRVKHAYVMPGTRLTIGSNTILLTAESYSEPAFFLAIDEVPVLPGIIAESRAMRSVLQQVARVAKSHVTVLLHGETGVGKEVVARAIHELSPRRKHPFEVVDCGSMAPSLIASELFGHERGAFTGAHGEHVGAFERADGGTVFLDEIGELPLDLQPMLLGVLARRRFRRVGGTRERSIDVRVIAATHRDLRSATNLGTFRADLYFRLAIARIVIPPLRERPEDIQPLVRHIAEQLTGDAAAQPFDPQTLAALESHPWSGNVRELRNVVESAVALGSVVLEGDFLSHNRDAAVSAVTQGFDPALLSLPYREARAHAVAEFERNYLQGLTAECGGNASEAARRARMDRPYLLSLLRKHGLR